MKIVEHTGMIWVVYVSGGWYKAIKAFPEATKKVGKGDDAKFVPDPNHYNVKQYCDSIKKTWGLI